MDENVSKTGVFIDSRTGKVVESAPEEGTQLVPPGGVIDDNAQRVIDAAKSATKAQADNAPVDLSVKEDVGDVGAPPVVSPPRSVRK